MNYCRTYIGKELRSVTISDVESYFDNVKEESDTIEYKSYYVKERNKHSHKHKESAIIRTICGLLNSEGGMVIWGAPMETLNTESQRTEYSGALLLVEKIIDKDSFISKVSQSIIPTPSGIKIEILPKGDKCLCVIEVPKSITKPHRYDGKYYMRLDGQTQVAPHHYVEALMKEVKYPNLEGYISITSIRKQIWKSTQFSLIHGKEYIWLGIQKNIINWSGHINAENVNFQIITEKGIFRKSLNSRDIDKYLHAGKQYRPTTPFSILFYGEPITSEHYIVIDPDDIKGLDTFMLLLTFGGKKSPMKWSTYQISVQSLIRGDMSTSLIIEDENSLAIDNHIKMGTNKATILKSLIGR